jgi:BNR/Asp-box repeat
MRRVVSILVLSTVALGAGASVAAAAGPQQTVNGTLISRPANTLAPGTTVAASEVYGNRVFIDANRGCALVQNGQAQYPAATTDGGKTWKTNGPALHVNAAQAPLAVAFIGAGGTKKIFAWGGGQVIDATPDGGAHWYRATFTGLPVAVLKNPKGNLVAFVDGQTGSSSVATQYVSKNGGKTWKLDNTIGGS